MSNMKNITTVLPEGYLKQITNLLEDNKFSSRSDCIRNAIEKFLIREKKINPILSGEKRT